VSSTPLRATRRHAAQCIVVAVSQLGCAGPNFESRRPGAASGELARKRTGCTIKQLVARVAARHRAFEIYLTSTCGTQVMTEHASRATRRTRLEARGLLNRGIVALEVRCHHQGQSHVWKRRSSIDDLRPHRQHSWSRVDRPLPLVSHIFLHLSPHLTTKK